jgi:hypothetical protein
MNSVHGNEEGSDEAEDSVESTIIRENPPKMPKSIAVTHAKADDGTCWSTSFPRLL